MKSRVSIFMQCLMCLLALVFCLVLRYRTENMTIQTGNFGFSERANDTMSHLAHNLYNGVYHE